METLRFIENKFAQWLKFLPNMPDRGQKILSDYLWVIALVSMLFSGFFILLILGLLSFNLASFGLGSIQSIDSGVTVVTVVAGLELILVFALSVAAIGPLRKHQRSGWDKMFIIALVSFVSAVLQFAYTINFYNVISAVIWMLIQAYFLLQVKRHFVRG